MLQPVYGLKPGLLARPTYRAGLLIGRRGIEPKLGEWGLPGGFVDLADGSYEAAATREEWEEVELADRSAGLSPPQLYFSTRGDPGQIIAFNRSTYSMPEWWLRGFTPCLECPEIRVAWEPEKLCFESHTLAMRRWFQEGGPARALDHSGLMDIVKSDAEAWASIAARQLDCEHEWVDAPELFDAHKNEDFRRCVKCLKVV